MSGYIPISEYKIIGDLYSAALVSNSGSIDWLCFPNFDSPAIFAEILDKDKGGSFSLKTKGYKTSSAYVPETAIVDTKCEGDKHSFLVRDYMFPQPVTECTNHVLGRKIIGMKGQDSAVFHFKPRTNYGKDSLNLTYNKRNKSLIGSIESDTVGLFLPDDADVKKKNSKWRIEVPIAAKQEKDIKLEYVEENAESCVDDHNFARETQKYWQRWIKRGDYFDFCEKLMKRSAITLKMLQFYPTGAIVAAPTTSLPETIGGKRNWDYRYTWMRDATFILYSLAAVDLQTEAGQFFRYLKDTLVEQVDINEIDYTNIANLDHFYTIDGNPVSPEIELDHLEGYKQSQPVRVGNSASQQFQLDSYGVVIDAFYLLYRDGMELTGDRKAIITALVEEIKKRWREKDNSIWEMRSGREHFTYSKVMCWVGVNRALRMKDELGYDSTQVNELKILEDKIETWIWNNCYREDKKAFAQHANTDAQDATTFLFPLVQFLDKDDPQTATIIESARDALCHNGVFAYRYRTEDGLPGREGAFNLCTFWMISALAKTGKPDLAYEIFNQYEDYIADSGLMSEEINPETGEYLGNFPQGFSHLGYIMAAYYLHKYQDPASDSQN